MRPIIHQWLWYTVILACACTQVHRDTNVCITHMYTAIHTYIYWIVPISIFLVVSKNLIMEKLA